ncbi:hypothetical protein GCM10029964_051880 [Kibdelosporangium lantanae]
MLTDWPEFRDLDWSKMDADLVVIDTRNALDPAALSGHTHIGTGRRP